MSQEIFTGGATTSQHIDAEDDDHFNNTTFQLKRTRSLGLLDEFIPKLETDEDKTSSEDPNDKINEKLNAKKSQDNDNENKSQASKETSLIDDKYSQSPEFVPLDDNDIEVEPEFHVDYFSHQWDVGDISKSWRYIIQKRKNVANSARLENASWRTWAQRRLNLKTINPEKLNWSKESDITWLYGPILKDEETNNDNDEHHHKHSTTATSAVAGDISIPSKNRGILKKRSVQDTMISHANLVKLEAMENRLKLKKEQQQQQLRDRRKKLGHKRSSSNEPPEFDDYDAISEKLNSQYKFSSTSLKDMENENSSLKSSLKSNNNSQTSFKSPEITSSQLESSESVDKKSRHIHFNTEVQQCIALDMDNENNDYDDDEYDDDYDLDDESNDYAQKSYIYTDDNDDENDLDDEDDDDDEDGGFFLKVRSPSSSSLAPQFKLKEFEPSPPSISQKTDDTDSISTNNSKTYRTIQILPSTNINWGSDDDTSDEENPYTSSLSHNVNNGTSRGYDYYYDYNTVYTMDDKGIFHQPHEDSPDVVDLPEDLANFLNFDNVPIMDNNVIIQNNYHQNSQSQGSNNEANKIKNNDSNITKGKGKFNLDDSDDSDSDSDEGLSIATRSSSQSLAHQVYESMTPHENQPINDNLASINPRHSSTGLSKQSTSSNSLSSQFFGTTNINNDLSSQFFGTGSPNQSSGIGVGRTSPLPPTTTQKNILSSGFKFGDDSDDEYVEDVSD